MFFQEDLIYNNFMCQICNNRLRDPVLLPCEEFACKSCIDDYIENNDDEEKKSRNQFNCSICKQDHSIPANGFLKSKAMCKFLEMKPKQVDKGLFVEKFKADVINCINEITEINSALANKEEIVRDHFELKRQQIHTITESKIDEIRKRSQELLNRIDEFEREHLANFQDTQKQAAIETDLKNAKEFCNNWIDRLKLPDTSEIHAKNERPILDTHIRLVQESKSKKNDYIFNEQKIEFVENQSKIESSFLGIIRQEKAKEEKIPASNNVSTTPKTFAFDSPKFEFDQSTSATSHVNSPQIYYQPSPLVGLGQSTSSSINNSQARPFGLLGHSSSATASVQSPQFNSQALPFGFGLSSSTTTLKANNSPQIDSQARPFGGLGHSSSSATASVNNQQIRRHQ